MSYTMTVGPCLLQVQSLANRRVLQVSVDCVAGALCSMTDFHFINP